MYQKIIYLTNQNRHMHGTNFTNSQNKYLQSDNKYLQRANKYIQRAIIHMRNKYSHRPNKYIEVVHIYIYRERTNKYICYSYSSICSLQLKYILSIIKTFSKICHLNIVKWVLFWRSGYKKYVGGIKILIKMHSLRFRDFLDRNFFVMSSILYCMHG
jgi:hypothetical protein